MNLDTFPTFKRLISTQGPTQWDKPLSPDQLQRLEQALATWQDGLNQGGIDNPRFVESKDRIGRALEIAWRAAPRDQAAVDQLPEAQRNALDTLPSPNLSNLAGRLKRVEKTPDSPTRTALMGLLQELTPLAQAYEFLKANTRKRQVKTEEERDAERFVPPPSSSKAVEQARAILEHAIDRAYQGLVDRYTLMNRRLIQTYLDAQQQALADPARAGKAYLPSTHLSRKNAQGRSEVIDPMGVAFLTEVLVSHHQHTRVPVYLANEQTWVTADRKAEEQAKLVREQFLYKNLAKLTPVLEAKGDEAFLSIQEVGRFDLSSLEGQFEVRFKDNSSFRLRNAVVFVVNHYGTHFNRFPTTFHDVVLPNGEPMPSPSEERMHTVFAQPASQAPARKGPKP